MPIYEYECPRCGRTSSFLVRDVKAHEPPSCPKCGEKEMHRVFSRFSTVGRPKSASSPDASGGEPPGIGDSGEGPEGIPDLEGLDELDENDPRSMARFMRQVEKQTGEKLDPKMNEVCRRLEGGEDPEAIEEDMGDSFPGDEEGGDSDDTLYDA